MVLSLRAMLSAWGCLTERAFIVGTPNRFKCPKCGRELPASGAVVIDGTSLSVFQCGECLRVVDFMGQRQEVALTFAVAPGPDGRLRPFDPADPDADLSK
jgi:hypothetical protein